MLDTAKSNGFSSKASGLILIGPTWMGSAFLSGLYYGGPLCQDTKIGFDKSYLPPFPSCVLNAFAPGLWKYTSAGVW